MEYFLGNPENLRMIPTETHLLQLKLGRWKKAFCPKIGNNEVSIDENFPLDYTRYSCMYSRILILDEKNFVQLG
jgi:hypothetical protein